jgi:hypothetical protein
VAVVAQSGRAGLVVNLKASRQEGADLDAAPLAVPDVIKDRWRGVAGGQRADGPGAGGGGAGLTSPMFSMAARRRWLRRLS